MSLLRHSFEPQHLRITWPGDDTSGQVLIYCTECEVELALDLNALEIDTMAEMARLLELHHRRTPS